MVPMFEDCAKIDVADNCSVGWLSASWKTQPSIVRVLGTVNISVGVMRPVCKAAENVTTLKTEPGLVHPSQRVVLRRLHDGPRWRAGGRGRRGGGRRRLGGGRRLLHHVGHGQDVAGVDIHHDGDAALGVRRG